MSTESGIVSESGTSFTTITTFEPPIVCKRDDIMCARPTSSENWDISSIMATSVTTATQTEFTTTWVASKSDGSVSTESGIISQSGTSLTTVTTFSPSFSSAVTQAGFTSTWVASNSDGSVATESGIVSKLGTSFTTLTTFAPTSSDSIETEYTSTWGVTNSGGSVSTESGVVSQSGTSMTTITTFTPTISSGGAETKYTSTWVATNSDGSESTKFGIISLSGTLLTTLATSPEISGTVYPVTTLFTTEYVTTCPNGELSTATGVVVVGTDSKGIEQTVTSAIPSTVYTEETVTSIVTLCIKNKCFESTTTLISSVPRLIQGSAAFTSKDNGHAVPVASIDATTRAASVSNSINGLGSTGSTGAGNTITIATIVTTATGTVTSPVAVRSSTHYPNVVSSIATSSGSGSGSSSGSGSGSGSGPNIVGVINPKVSSGVSSSRGVADVTGVTSTVVSTGISGATIAATSTRPSGSNSSTTSGKNVLPLGANNVGSNQTPTINGGNSNPSKVTGASGSPSYVSNSLSVSLVSSQTGARSSSTGVTIPITTENSGSKFSVGTSVLIAAILTIFIGFI